MNSTVLQVEGLGKCYGEKWVVQDLSFQLQRGQVLALLGPNGAGKSTTLKMILGLKRASRGRVKLFGESLAESTRHRIGFTSQSLSFPPQLKVLELLKLLRVHFSRTLPLDVLIERFDLNPILQSLLGTLSGGELRRVGLAVAFCNEPELVILDEPTTALDVHARLRFWKELEAYVEVGGSVLLCTHDLVEASDLADQVLLMERGRGIYFGEAQKIKQSVYCARISFAFSNADSSLPPLQNVISSECIEGRQHLTTRTPDELLRELVERQVPFQDLKIHETTLEEAFLHFSQRSK